MCYSGYMTENMVELKETPAWRSSSYRLWKWLLGSITALKESVEAVSEDATGTYGTQPSNTNSPKRGYEVVAVIPIELFVPGNRRQVRKKIRSGAKPGEINNSEEEAGKKFTQIFPDDNPEHNSKIGKYIKDFSAYEYEIYELQSKQDKDSWSKAVCEIVNNEIGKCKSKYKSDDKEIYEAIKGKLQKGDNNECYLDTNIILAMPFVPKKDNDTADINKNTGIVISIQISVPHIQIDGNESNIAMAKFLKLIGDGLSNAINDCPETKVDELIKDEKTGGISKLIKLIADLLPKFDDNGLQNRARKPKEPLHDKIEINYVFTYFICKGFDFHIITDPYEVNDNIKYSGDAWFLKKGKIYKLKDNVHPIGDDYNYITEKFYNGKLGTEKQAKYAEVESYNWLTETLIPEATIRPKDIYYIPKIDGGELHDYSSVLLKFRNRLCCFIKKEYVENEEKREEEDDRNRIIAMQIVLNSFWHRLSEFSRVMQKMCLSRSSENIRSKNSDGDATIMSDMEDETRKSFSNQIYTTPTLPEQILDINSTDQDVLTLYDLTVSSKIDSAANIFSEVKKNFLALNATEEAKKRTDEAKKAEMGIQGMFLILALIASAIGLIELWADWNIDLWLEIFGTVLLFILVVGYLDWRYWGKLSKIRGKCRKIWEKYKSRSKGEEEPSENNSEKLQ